MPLRTQTRTHSLIGHPNVPRLTWMTFGFWTAFDYPDPDSPRWHSQNGRCENWWGRASRKGKLWQVHSRRGQRSECYSPRGYLHLKFRFTQERAMPNPTEYLGWVCSIRIQRLCAHTNRKTLHSVQPRRNMRDTLVNKTDEISVFWELPL